MIDYAVHTPFSEPGDHAALLAAVEPTPAAIHHAATATIAHYRGEAGRLGDCQEEDVNLRWLRDILGVATARQAGPLDSARTAETVLAGCCRDHSLLGVGVFRQHGMPARSVVGFAGYFVPDFYVDHVVIEHLTDDGWRRFDPELDPEQTSIDPRDEGAASFLTAAQTWQGIRAGELDPMRFGVAPDIPELIGQELVGDYVIIQLAHRMGYETLLWDAWGAMGPFPGVDAARLPEDLADHASDAAAGSRAALIDEIAGLLAAADAGDAQADAELARRWNGDPRLRPGRHAVTGSPTGRGGLVDFEERALTWL